MNYIVFDLEFNQKLVSTTEIEANNTPSLLFEIIQIGALKLNQNFETISTFNTLVKPTVYPKIHPYVENLTKINDAMVSSCKIFKDVYSDFINFIGAEEAILCVWGVSDIKELLRNIKFYKFPTSTISKYYIDVQKYASKHLNTPKGHRIGLGAAIELLDLPTEGDFHDAFNDAYYTAEVFKKIYNDTMKPGIYTPNPPRRIDQPKEKVDTAALINQFEKMYDREMTSEEKSIIELAYKMGRSRQFIIQDKNFTKSIQ